jgi:hypothetical protein
MAGLDISGKTGRQMLDACVFAMDYAEIRCLLSAGEAVLLAGQALDAAGSARVRPLPAVARMAEAGCLH